MSTCSKILKMLPVTSDSVSAEEYRSIMRHLDECPACRRIQENLLAVDRAALEITVPDPGDKYFDNFPLSVHTRLAAGQSARPIRVVEWFTARPILGWSAVAAVVALAFFITRGMISEGKIPVSAPIAQTEIVSGQNGESVGPEAPVEISSIDSRSIPTEAIEETGEATEVNPAADNNAERLAGQDDSADQMVTRDMAPETTELPVAVETAPPAENTTSVWSAADREDLDNGLPTRQTFILRGDTTEASISTAGLPEGRELERAERPNAPFPDYDSGGDGQARRLLGSPGDQGLAELSRTVPTLNRDTFTEVDYKFFEKRAKELEDEFAKKKEGERKREICRKLVDIYYQMAINWRIKDDIKKAVDFTETAHTVLPEKDHADLVAKKAALETLLGR